MLACLLILLGKVLVTHICAEWHNLPNDTTGDVILMGKGP